MSEREILEATILKQQQEVYKEVFGTSKWTIIRHKDNPNEPIFYRNKFGVVDNMIDCILERGKMLSKQFDTKTREAEYPYRRLSGFYKDSFFGLF